jgi:hypothetical protein
MDGTGREAAPGVHKSGWNGDPRGKRLGQVQSAVWGGYGAREGT